MKTDSELKQLAIDLTSGLIFTDRSLEDKSLMQTVFMPLIFLSGEERDKFLKRKPVLIYEYLSKAGPRSIDGYPMFFSLQTLVQKEFDALLKYVKEIEEFKKKFQDIKPVKQKKSFKKKSE